MNQHPPSLNSERGITALETAVILIAFVVAATLFAYTILSSGTFLTERSKESAHASLSQVEGAVQMKGSVIAQASLVGHQGTVAALLLTVANVAGGQPVDFSTNQRVVQIEYRDEYQRVPITNWTFTALGYDDGDSLLEQRELFEIIIPTISLPDPMGPNRKFTIEIKPPIGAPLQVQRTIPATIDSVMDLK
jgi:flagellin FlaB